MKLQDMKLYKTGNIAGHENARREHDAPKMTAECEIAGEKSTLLTEITLQRSVQIFKPTTL